MVKKKPATEPPADWICMELAVPPEAWRVFVRASIRMKCDPADVINHVLKLGFEGYQKFEAEEHTHDKAIRH